jgi:hypothetical protein
MSRFLKFAVVAAFIARCWSVVAIDYRGTDFIGITNLDSFGKSTGPHAEQILTSPELGAGLAFDELILSWNADAPPGTSVRVEAAAINSDRKTKFYGMGIWSSDPSKSPRESVLHQKDDNGNVSTDTLILKHAAQKFQLRLTLAGTDGQTPAIRCLGICLTDTRQKLDPLPPNKSAWGKALPVPRKSQMWYPNGNVICSPTTVSMLLGFWSETLDKPEINKDVPEVMTNVYDSNWHGTGNWPFNMAYAGSLPGLRACVSRFSDVSELEDWIAKGLPVGMSLDYDRLREKGPGPNGHLVVCVGFTKDGDVIINDPGTSKNIQKTFPRKDLIYAWSASHNAVYLVYPIGSQLPDDRFHHWSY